MEKLFGLCVKDSEMGSEAKSQDTDYVSPGDGSVTLRGKPSNKEKTGKWRAAAFIYALAGGNLAVLMGIQGNLISYTVGYLHLDNATAANITSNLSGTALLLPIFFGFLADAYLGPFWVIVGSCFIYVVGLTTLILSVSLPSLMPTQCSEAVCPRASSYVISVFEAGIFITCTATAGIKPTVLSLGQRQFDETDPVEKNKGKIFFSVYFAVYSSCLLMASTLFFWIQTDVGYKQGYAVMAAFFFLCAIIFFTGTPFLRHQRPTGSPLTTLVQVLVAAVRNWRKELPADPSELYEITGETSKLNICRIRKIAHTNRLRYLDKAAIVPHDRSSSRVFGGDKEQQHRKSQLRSTISSWDNWKLCTVTQVEVLKIVIQIIPIWFCCGMMYLIAAQEFTFFIQQAAGMDRSLGPNFSIPPATITSFSMIGALIFFAVYEFLLVPVLKKWTGNPRGLSPLVRIGLGLFLAFTVMVIAALVEIRRVNAIQENNISALQIKAGLIPISAYWLTPQLVIGGIIQPLLGTAQLELFYQEAPETMVSLAMALSFGSQAIGRFVSTGIVDSVKNHTHWLTTEFNSGGLTRFYWLIAVILAVNFVGYVIAANLYSVKKLQNQHGGYSEAKSVHGKPINGATGDIGDSC